MRFLRKNRDKDQERQELDEWRSYLHDVLATYDLYGVELQGSAPEPEAAPEPEPVPAPAAPVLHVITDIPEPAREPATEEPIPVASRAG